VYFWAVSDPHLNSPSSLEWRGKKVPLKPVGVEIKFLSSNGGVIISLSNKITSMEREERGKKPLL